MKTTIYNVFTSKFEKVTTDKFSKLSFAMMEAETKKAIESGDTNLALTMLTILQDIRNGKYERGGHPYDFDQKSVAYVEYDKLNQVEKIQVLEKVIKNFVVKNPEK